MDSALVLLHLSLIEGIGPATIELLSQKTKTEQLHDLYDATIADVTALGISAEKLFRAIISPKRLVKFAILII